MDNFKDYQYIIMSEGRIIYNTDNLDDAKKYYNEIIQYYSKCNIIKIKLLEIIDH